MTTIELDDDGEEIINGFIVESNNLNDDQDDLTIINVHNPNQITISEQDKKKSNDSKNILKCWYTNEVKYARELKIHLKGPTPLFYPNIPFDEAHAINFRRKRPRLGNKEYGVDKSNDMWILNHANRFSNLAKCVGKLYCVHIREKDRYHSEGDDSLTKLTNSGDGSNFRIITATWFITKLERRKVVWSPLHWFMRPEDFPLGDSGKDKPLTYACFDQKDYTKELRIQWQALKNSCKLTRETVQMYLESSALTKIKIMKEWIKARKDWLKTNFKSAELLDSEFYNQVFPSIDIAFSDISPNYINNKKIGHVKVISPDHSYWDFGLIGFQEPYEIDFQDYKYIYGCSKWVLKDSNHYLNSDKSLSIGKVRSYGAITTVTWSASIGGAGSPWINELGQAWGIVLNCHYDTPKLEDDSDSENDKDKKNELFQIKRVKKTKYKGKQYYDIISDHSLKPLVQTSNSYNRNLVLTFGHSAVKYIIDVWKNSIVKELKKIKADKSKLNISEESSQSEVDVPENISSTAANLLAVHTEKLSPELQQIAQKHAMYKTESGGVVKNPSNLQDINGPDNIVGHQILEAKINKELSTMKRSKKQISKITNKNDSDSESSQNSKRNGKKKLKKEKKHKKDKKKHKKEKKSKKHKRIKIDEMLEDETKDESFKNELIESTKSTEKRLSDSWNKADYTIIE